MSARHLLAALGLIGATASVAGAQFPAQPPAPSAPRPFRFPVGQEIRLENGLQMVVVENAELPVASLSLILPAGTRHDPAGKEGVAMLASELVLQGTATRSAEQIALRTEAIGATFRATVDGDYLTISADLLSEHVGVAFELMADVVAHAAFPQPAFDAAQERLRGALEAARTSPEAIADRVFVRALFGDHPYGRRASLESVSAVSRADVAAFAASRFRPQGALLVVAGAVRAAEVQTLARRALAGWRGAPPPGPPPVAAPRAQPTRIVLVHRLGAVQTQVLMGNVAPPPSDARSYALVVANHLLSGGESSRLFRVLGQEKRWTYDVRSELVPRRDFTYFMTSAQVPQQVADQVVAELGEQLEKLGSEVVPDSELVAAKRYLAGAFPRQAETMQQVARQTATARLNGLGADYVPGYAGRILGVNAEQLRDAARSGIRPDSSVIVVFGDGAKLYDRLKMIAPVELVDLSGRTLTAADLAPRAGPLQLDRSQLTARRDSFLVLVQGNPLGTFVNETVLAGDSLVYRERLYLPVARWEQQTVARMDPGTLAMRDVVQTGQSGVQAGETRLTYQAGRVKGRVQIPQGAQSKVTEIDTTIVEGTVDQTVLPLVVPGLPLEPNTSYSLNVFDASTGTVRSVTATVTAVGNLSVPAGVFPVFQVQVTGSSNAMVLYITRDVPRRVVRVEQMGRPMSFELVK